VTVGPCAAQAVAVISGRLERGCPFKSQTLTAAAGAPARHREGGREDADPAAGHASSNESGPPNLRPNANVPDVPL
jgi:hypothetical protein